VMCTGINHFINAAAVVRCCETALARSRAPFTDGAHHPAPW